MKKIILAILFLSLNIGLSAQSNMVDSAKEMLAERGEIYFSFQLSGDLTPEYINYVSRVISIDKVKDKTVYAYANSKSFNHFLEFDIKFNLLTPPSMRSKPFMLDSEDARNRADWDFYPTYEAYVDIMTQFATDYPHLCELVSIETLASSREILLLHINDSLGVAQNEPEFLYTSSMHGDETSGYVLMLHLIDYLLSNYGLDDQATNLVENVDIWINPLANPDGTYAGGNNSVSGATRGNANYIDLNRNYPDPEDGTNPDGNAHQIETLAFMDFAEERNFVMSTNMHDGTEVCNYPWDTYSKRHPDDDWWIYVCRQYADTAHIYSPDGYLSGYNNGITNGYDWYSISGGRQDYMNYFHHCREFTLEISEQKLLPAGQLEDFWEYNYRSFLNYMEQVLYGVQGIVTNIENGEPVIAQVFVEDHDEDESQVYSLLPFGNYFRPIKEGVYDITFSAAGYYPKTVYDVNLTDYDLFELNVELTPIETLTADFYANDSIIAIGTDVNFYDASTGGEVVAWEWEFEGGTPATSNQQNPENILYSEVGFYDVILKVTDSDDNTDTHTLNDYIRVSEMFTMSDTTIYIYEGLFYDSGGEDEYYLNDEDYIITFVSVLESRNISGALKATFREFDVEHQDNCEYDYLQAFDGSGIDAPLIGTWCGDELPETIITTNVEGALTFKFHSNSTINRPGWKTEITSDISLDISDIEEISVCIYPNPANDLVTVLLQESGAQISICDISGKLLSTINMTNKKMDINVSGLKSGIYFLKVMQKDNIVTNKLFIK